MKFCRPTVIWRKTIIIFELSNLNVGRMGVHDISSGQCSQKEHFQQLRKTRAAEIGQTAPSCTLPQATKPHLVSNEGAQCVRHPRSRQGVCQMDPLGHNVDKIGFFVKTIDFCLMPARNLNLQRQGGGGGLTQCPVGPNRHQN